MRVVNRGVAAVAVPGEDRLELFLEAAQHSLTDDGAEVLILAGAVLSGLEVELGDRLAVPVLDPVKCAVAQAQALVQLGLHTSRYGGFAHSPRKACLNCPPEIKASVYEPPEERWLQKGNLMPEAKIRSLAAENN